MKFSEVNRELAARGTERSGEALAEQMIDGKSEIGMSSFRLKRFKDLIQ
jgi:hypothetical protein